MITWCTLGSVTPRLYTFTPWPLSGVFANIKPTCTVWVYCAKDTKCVCHEWEIGMHSMFVPNTCDIPHTQGVSYMYCTCMHSYCMCTRTCIVCNDKIKFWFYIGKESTSGILGDRLADVCTSFDGFREVPTIPTKRRPWNPTDSGVPTVQGQVECCCAVLLLPLAVKNLP